MILATGYKLSFQNDVHKHKKTLIGIV